MGEGNVLTRVCPSVCPQGGGVGQQGGRGVSWGEGWVSQGGGVGQPGGRGGSARGEGWVSQGGGVGQPGGEGWVSGGEGWVSGGRGGSAMGGGVGQPWGGGVGQPGGRGGSATGGRGGSGPAGGGSAKIEHIGSTCCMAGGMPLAFTQEDFLVLQTVLRHSSGSAVRGKTFAHYTPCIRVFFLMG